MTAWNTFTPTAQKPWDVRRVAHLHRRAVFGLTASELRRDVASKPQDAISRVFSGEGREGVPLEFANLQRVIGDAAVGQGNVNRLKAWWIYQLIFSPDPLRERLTFLWHNHFATSNLKVNSLLQMKEQNELFREHARGEFGTLLHATLRDPALLRWLDAETNRKDHANENLGRELLELFTLGVGNFTEADVKNAARALTGLEVERGEFRFNEGRHDDGEKTVLGQTKHFDPEELAELLLADAATSWRLAGKLIAEFFAPGVIDKAAHAELAHQLTASHLNVGRAVETILRSDLFFSDDNINQRITDPLTFLIAPIRSFELFETPPSTLTLADWLQRMGLDLFYPPNVAGWPGGRAWLTTRTVIARANYAAAVVSGEIHRVPSAPDLERLAATPDDFQTLMNTLLTGSADDNFSGEEYSEIALKILTGTRVHLH
ncbi:MAG: DUF1800 family protein [Planctomycetota bacterium]